MNRDSKRQILDMLASGRLTVDEAEKLLLALESRSHAATAARRPHGRMPSHLRVVVDATDDDDDDHRTLDMRIPIATLKAGLHLPGILPDAVSEGINRALSEKGVNLDVRRLKHRDISLLIEELQDVEIDIKSYRQRVLIYVE